MPVNKGRAHGATERSSARGPSLEAITTERRQKQKREVDWVQEEREYCSCWKHVIKEYINNNQPSNNGKYLLGMKIISSFS